MIKIVIADYYYPDQAEEEKVYRRLGPDTEIVDCTKIVKGGVKDPDELIGYVKDADALVVQFAKVNRKVIESMERCKVIARYAIGVDTIDVEAATEKGIYVANVSDYCISEVANTAIAHIMNAERKIACANAQLKENRFDMNGIRPMHRMETQTLGLLGFGNIARNVAEKMKGFFREIVVSDPYFQKQEEYPEYRFAQMDEVLKCADVISLHVPLNKSTEKMISREAFSKMKPGVILVNTARGGLIDEDALLDALEEGRVACCGLDVLSEESFENSRLLRRDDVLLSPHIGWCSEESVVELQRKTAENVVETLLHGKPRYAVNKW